MLNNAEHSLEIAKTLKYKEQEFRHKEEIRALVIAARTERDYLEKQAIKVFEQWH